MRKVGVVGLGNRAFIMSYFNDIDGWEVAAAADVRQSCCDAFKEKYPGVVVSTDYHDMLKDPEIVAVFVL